MGVPSQNAERDSSFYDESWDATILHIDMDAFFLSVELLDQPQIRGVPAVVAGKSGRSVVTSASYEARAFGVRSAMPVGQAKHLCPHLVVLEPHREKYVRASQEVMRILGSITPLVEQLSIDEAFIDVSGARRSLGSPARIAELLKAKVLHETGLPSTIGVARNKSVAKIVSDRSKPDALGIVPATRTREYLAPLPVEVIWGVGPKLKQRLNNADIHTVGDLAGQNPERLSRWLGAIGPQIVALARGEDERPVQPRQEAKSVSVEHTFERDISDVPELHKSLLDLSYECARRLRTEGLVAHGITVKVKDPEFVTRTRSRSIPASISSGAIFFQNAQQLLYDLMKQRLHPVRLLGVRADRISAPHEETYDQGILFEMADDLLGANADLDWESTDQILDDVEKKFPRAALMPASLLNHSRDRRIPDN